MKKISPFVFLLAKLSGRLNHDVGVQKGAPYVTRNGRELVSKPAISFKKTLGGLP